MKRYFRYVKVSLLLVICMSLFGCNSPELNGIKEDGNLHQPVKIYYVERSGGDFSHDITYLLQRFANEHPEINIEAVCFDSNKSFMDRVSVEMSVGEGADLFILDYGTNFNFYKMAQNGSLLNLSTYMENDKTFHNEDYFLPMLHAGKIKEQQLFFPLGCGTANLYTTKEKLQKNGISMKASYSFEEIMNMLTQSVSKSDQATPPVAMDMSSTVYLTTLMTSFGVPILDENYEIILDKDVLRTICDWLRLYEPYCSKAQSYDYLAYSEYFPKIDYYLCDYGYYSKLGFYKLMMQQINQESVAIACPGYDNQSLSAFVFYYVVANGDSKNPQSSYEVAKKLMDMAVGQGNGWNLPANRASMKQWLENDITNSQRWVTEIDGREVSTVHSEEYAAEIWNTTEAIENVTLPSRDMIVIIEEEMSPYIEGKAPFEDCYEILVNKLNLYMNE